MNDEFKLVGHLQVLDEALSSLYSSQQGGKLFLFVRIYEDCDDSTFLLSEVRPSIVIDYIERKVGLKQIFSHSPSYYYKRKENMHTLYSKDFISIGVEEVYSKLLDGSLDDLFSYELACNSIGIKRHLQETYL